MNPALRLLIPALVILLATGSPPDLRQTIDFEREGSFHLGPTGAQGWIHTDPRKMTTAARQILITEVEPGTPAAGVLESGDVILGVAGKPFSEDARMALGNAIDRAEAADGILELIRWRPENDAQPRRGTEETVKLQLDVLGSYADTAPYDCPKTGRILEKAIARLLEQKDWGKFGDKALALLATGDPRYHPAIRDHIHGAKLAKPDLEISLVGSSAGATATTASCSPSISSRPATTTCCRRCASMR